MKFPIVCFQCALVEEGGRSRNHKAVMLEVRDQGSYETVCSRGHRVGTVLTNAKFQVLYEIGVHAIGDGYYREAVGSFAASLERFYEFCCRVMALHLQLLDVDWKAAIKALSGSSERELGGFVLMYLVTFKKAPAILVQDMVKLRNDVVHKGRIPTREIALRYGEAVRDVIESNLAAMRSHAPQAIEDAIAEISEVALEGLPDGTSKGWTLQLDLVISLNDVSDRVALEDEVRRCIEFRQEMMGGGHLIPAAPSVRSVEPGPW